MQKIFLFWFCLSFNIKHQKLHLTTFNLTRNLNTFRIGRRSFLLPFWSILWTKTLKKCVDLLRNQLMKSLNYSNLQESLWKSFWASEKLQPLNNSEFVSKQSHFLWWSCSFHFLTKMKNKPKQLWNWWKELKLKLKEK
jgi:hypothetical protein